jgi:glucose-1-phosphate cytidylyltransferase
MKAVILAGGLGTRLSEETDLRPKPMVEIGQRPIIWHIMKIYSQHGINEFIVCCGYLGYVIKEYFTNYFMHMSDISIDLSTNNLTVHKRNAEPWKITLVDTGKETLTGGRLKRVQEHLRNEDAFCLTYGDGLANIDIKKLIKFHKSHGKSATITAVVPPGRYGALEIDGDHVTSFKEKPEGGLINGGFFVLSPEVLNFIKGDTTSWENGPLSKLASLNQLVAYKHYGFWQPMDTLREKNLLQELWDSGEAPWKTW